MLKQEFLLQLKKGLSGLPQNDIEERLAFYNEMIEDRVEEGLSEEEAVCAVGSVSDIVAQAIAEIPLTKLAKERIKPKRRLKVWEIVLLALGSPIWLSLGIAAIAVLFSIEVVMWAAIVSLWTIFASLVVCALGGVALCVMLAIGGNIVSAIAVLAAGVFCAGLSVFAFCGCRIVTESAVLGTKKAASRLKKRLIQTKEEG